MFVTLLTYLIPIIQVVLPIYFVHRIWTQQFKIKTVWLLRTGHAVLAIVLLFMIGRWDMVGHSLRYGLNGLCLIGLGLSYLKVRELPFYERKFMHWRWGEIAEIVLFIAAITWALTGYNPEKKTVNMKKPLKGSSYYVIQGGETPILNYHGAVAHPQQYALDINKVNNWGFRASGFSPAQPGDYAVFGDTVYSPVSGRVVQVVDRLPDQDIPKSNPKQPAGNHIWIKTDSLYVVLAHLKHNSVRVDLGEKVRTGQSIARVGNTGNTTEPHLHLHVVKFPEENSPNPDSLLYGGQPVPITFDGRFLTRNSWL